MPAATKNDIPKVYQWLATQKNNWVICEYPFVGSKEYLRVYYATYHWKQIVNGFSGYPGPTYSRFYKAYHDHINSAFIDELLQIKVNMLVIHKDPDNPEGWDRTVSFLETQEPSVTLIKSFSAAKVYIVDKVHPERSPDDPVLEGLGNS